MPDNPIALGEDESGSYLSVGGMLRIKLNKPSRTGSICALC